MSVHSVTDDCPKRVYVAARWLFPCSRESQSQNPAPHQNTKAENKPPAGSRVSPVILRNKVTIGEVIAGNGIPQVYTVEKIARNRDAHLWLPVAAENNVWPSASSRVDIFPDHSERLGLNLARSNALQPAFKLMLRITDANERHNSKNNKPQSESNWHDGLNECIKLEFSHSD
jgi:hypothetical protein